MGKNDLIVVSALPILASLRLLEQRIGPLDLRAGNEEQETFLWEHWGSYGEEEANGAEIDHVVASSGAELQEFFDRLGIRADGAENSGRGMVLASSMDISPRWQRAGSRVIIEIEEDDRARQVRGIWLSAGVMNITIQEHGQVISLIRGAIPGEVFYLTPWPECPPQSGLQLLEKVNELMAKILDKHTFARFHRGVVFPRVEETCRGYGLSELKGLELSEAVRLGGVFQHFRFALDESGVYKGDADKSSFLKATGHSSRPNHIIKQPFVIWQQDISGRIVFAAYVGEAAFQLA